MRNTQRGESELSFLVYIVILIVCYALDVIFAMMVSEERAIRTMEAQGYHDVRVVEKNIFFISFRGCDGSDAARFVVTAKNTAEKDARVYVCAGFFKGGTIRVD